MIWKVLLATAIYVALTVFGKELFADGVPFGWTRHEFETVSALISYVILAILCINQIKEHLIKIKPKNKAEMTITSFFVITWFFGMVIYSCYDETYRFGFSSLIDLFFALFFLGYFVYLLSVLIVRENLKSASILVDYLQPKNRLERTLFVFHVVIIMAAIVFSVINHDNSAYYFLISPLPLWIFLLKIERWIDGDNHA